VRPLPTPEEAVSQVIAVRGRVVPTELHRLIGTAGPGINARFADEEGAGQLADGIGLAVHPGLIYAGQAGAWTSRATLGSRIRGNHLGSDIYGSTFRLTLASALRSRLELEAIGGGHMSRDGEGRLTDWMRKHLTVSVIAYPDRLGLNAFETLVLAPAGSAAQHREAPSHAGSSDAQELAAAIQQIVADRSLDRASAPAVAEFGVVRGRRPDAGRPRSEPVGLEWSCAGDFAWLTGESASSHDSHLGMFA
jgi:GIY-YIG catalytic domain-containing protein